ncbi:MULTISPECIES: SIS domain-containing protein [Marinobacter]|jgi:D-sedoheptulose 7-phosphate isomerase|uniref:D-sedoheptulose 7-phosphate isomerase n=2 Tax=Pseudomonadota TaxID=1224 RepID=W5YV27_9GAMM|nr:MULTISPECIES: SIS domain-containing protein [Marinobacter]AHI32734.1 phosphoheptose isomerase [Marinobacter salarius]ARM85383.1 phosphoheptose isomerase [Marinobacter salarius]AZR40249.1 D-sedoheptulose 7-phosphate isomerase [Marinobacter salarius]KXJ44085.1 MAG: phosphoheptose isomerase [Marinobacter sp. Hex_13]MAB50256.1 SIS domain-containing protein [Marinobacter sp.]|tara:strand:- start:43 stop:633 length:591 start_codon:yes stop_codon:yes gene_type:complete
MTDTEQQINQWFANHMEHTAHAASLTAPAIESAADALVNTLLNDGKIITCANGNANVLTQYFCTALLNRFEHDRPALPAINLGADATTYSAICRDNRFNDTFSRQVRAIGKANDLLLVIVDDGHKANLIQAIQAAHDREMNVVVLSAKEKTDITSLLHPEDHEIALDNLSPTAATPILLVIINALCGLIDEKLFGG